MNGSLHRLLARGLMVVAALLAVCAFHSPSSAVEGLVTADSAVMVDSSSCPVGDDDTHLSVPGVMGVASVVGALVASPCRTASVNPLHASELPSALPRQTTPSLIQLRISRR
ncbi:hypothetical protein OG474_40720 [Kribbella sp. NBC_01505]|uniref:hypothetical protein n=1 Tax=Kribbella sp. NBC_01505 TaxID=2903580 RepID=UPI00386983F7